MDRIIHKLRKEVDTKLVHLSSGFIVAEYQSGILKIHDRILNREMMIRGILIPPNLRKIYDGKPVVRIGDREFGKVFKELYSSQVFNSKNYRWERLDF